jgi:hypothetical protein
MGMLFLVQNFTQLPKNFKVHVAHSLFLKKVLPSFEIFENILPHLDTERKERKGWDVILHILDTVKLVPHS